MVFPLSGCSAVAAILHRFCAVFAISCAVVVPVNAWAQTAVPTLLPTVKTLTEYDEYTGRFESVNRVEIHARVSGYLAQVVFDEGSIVEAGQQLAVIDQRPFTIAVTLAEARLAEMQAAADLAALEADRARALRADRAVSQEEVDQLIQEQIAANARVAGAQVRVDEAKLNLEFSVIRAPITGRVGRRLIDVGNLINGGNTRDSLITTIVQEDPLYFYFQISESDFLRYARLNNRGERPSSRSEPNPVRVQLLDESDFPHQGVMNFVDNELDSSTGTLEGRALIENPTGFLQPGVFGRVQLIGSAEYDAVMVPDEVIQFDQSRQFVYVIDPEGLAERRFVEIGPIVDGLRIIRDGITRDEQVISGAFHRVRAGDSVKSEAVAGDSP